MNFKKKTRSFSPKILCYKFISVLKIIKIIFYSKDTAANIDETQPMNVLQEENDPEDEPLLINVPEIKIE